jgi:putative peptide zinc metalloprotease protein
VQAGELIVRLESPLLSKELAVLEAEISALRSEHAAVSRNEVTERRLLALDISTELRAVDVLRRRIAALEIRASTDGRYAPPDQRVLAGRYVKQGDALGFVVGPGDMLVKAIIEQQHLGRVQNGILSSTVRLAEQLDSVIQASLAVQIPAADRRLPSPALASAGNGGIAVAMTGEDELRTLVPVFHVELKLPETAVTSGIGGRAYVTLQHPAESLGKRWWRTTRQLFLEQLSV